jgi:hypothetical protein
MNAEDDLISYINNVPIHDILDNKNCTLMIGRKGGHCDFHSLVSRDREIYDENMTRYGLVAPK